MYREKYLRINEHGVLYISAACGACLPTEIDIYECGGQMLLVGNLADGMYHLSPKGKSCNGKYLVAKQVVAYMMEKLGVDVGDRIPARASEGDGNSVVAFGMGDRPCKLDSNFHKVVLPYKKLIEGRVRIEGGQLLLATGVLTNRRYSAYVCKDAVAIFKDREGSCVPVPRQQRQYDAISATPFIQCILQKFGRGAKLMFLKTKRGIIISDKQNRLYGAAKEARFFQFSLPAMPEAYLALSDRKVVYFSKEGGQALGAHFSVKTQGELVALVPDKRGDLYLHYQNRYSCCSATFKQLIADICPGAKRLYLTPYVGMYLLTPDGLLPQVLPARELFQRCPMEQRVNGLAYARLTERQIWFTKPAAEQLEGNFSVQVTKNAVHLHRDPNGRYILRGPTRTVLCSSGLCNQLAEQFGCASGDVIAAIPTSDGLALLNPMVNCAGQRDMDRAISGHSALYRC